VSRNLPRSKTESDRQKCYNIGELGIRVYSKARYTGAILEDEASVAVHIVLSDNT